MKHLLLFILPILFLASSCTIKQEIEIRTDQSGSMAYTIDMSSMMALVGDDTSSTDGGGSLLDDPEFQQSLDELQKTDGITKVMAEEDEDKGIYRFGFDFRDVDILNTSMASTDMTTDNVAPDHRYVTIKKRGRLVHFELPQADSEDLEGVKEMGDEMANMMRYNLILKFERPIKKVKTKLEYSKSSDGHEINIEVPLKTLLDPESPFELDVYLK